MPKYKNYKNKYTKNNIIHTTDDLMRMTLREMAHREPELRSQYKQIGLPTTSDMQNSSNVVYVNAYTKSDGTEVSGYWRSKGEDSITPQQLPNSESAPINIPTDVMDEKHPDYPIYDYSDWEIKPGKALPPDEITYDENGNPVISGRVYNPNTDGGYENKENPSPSHLPTKAPDGPVEQPNNGSNGGVWGKIGGVLGGVGNVLGGVLGTIVENLPQVLDIISNLKGNSNTIFTESPSTEIPNITTHQIKPIKFENVNDISNVNNLDFSNIDNISNKEPKIKPLEPLSSKKNITNFTPQIQQVTSYNNSNQKAKIIPEGKAVDIKPKELTFEGAKFQDSKPIHLPSATANPLSKGTAEYMNKLLQTTTENAKDFGKGVLQGASFYGAGLGKRYGNKFRQAVGKPPLSQDEMDNLYSKVLGKPEENNANKTGNIIGEIIPFLIMPTVEVASFPLITSLLLTSLYQSFVDSATRSMIDNGISKKLISDVIKGVALALLNTLLAHGLLKGVDQSKLLKELEKRLQKLFNELAEGFSKPIRQADGTVVLKGYNGDIATPEEIAERIIRNLRKRQKENRKEREYIKKHLKENPKRFIINNKEYKQIWLPEKEHGAVRSAFTTYIMQNNYTEPTLIRCYGDYVYTAVLEEVDGQLLPVFVKKKKIKGVKR